MKHIHHHLNTFETIRDPHMDDPTYRHAFIAVSLAEGSGGDLQAAPAGSVRIHRPIAYPYRSHLHRAIDDHAIRLLDGRLQTCVSLRCDEYSVLLDDGKYHCLGSECNTPAVTPGKVAFISELVDMLIQTDMTPAQENWVRGVVKNIQQRNRDWRKAA